MPEGAAFAGQFMYLQLLEQGYAEHAGLLTTHSLGMATAACAACARCCRLAGAAAALPAASAAGLVLWHCTARLQTHTTPKKNMPVCTQQVLCSTRGIMPCNTTGNMAASCVMTTNVTGMSPHALHHTYSLCCIVTAAMPGD
jgi:hypothetical protein